MTQLSFITTLTALREMVERACSVVPSATFNPMLRNLLVEVRPDQLRISGTDLDLSVIVTVSQVTPTSEFTFTVPAQRLRDILKQVPEGDVAVSVTEPAEGIRVVEVLAGGAHWSLRVPDTGFPALPDLDQVEFHDFSRAAFLAAVRAVRFAASSDGANQGLACIAIDRNGDGSAKVTASDGARLQQARLAAFPLSIRIPAIGSPAAVDEAVRLLSRNEDLETAQVAASDAWLVFRAGIGVFVSRRLTVPGADVDHQILRPAMENKQQLSVDRGQLLAAIHRVRITADAATSAICLRLEPGKVTVLSRDKQENQAEQEIDTAWTGPSRSLVVHHGFLEAAVLAVPGPVCHFRLASTGKTMLLLRDDEAGIAGVIGQMTGKFLGY